MNEPIKAEVTEAAIMPLPDIDFNITLIFNRSSRRWMFGCFGSPKFIREWKIMNNHEDSDTVTFHLFESFSDPLPRGF